MAGWRPVWVAGWLGGWVAGCLAGSAGSLDMRGTPKKLSLRSERSSLPGYKMELLLDTKKVSVCPGQKAPNVNIRILQIILLRKGLRTCRVQTRTCLERTYIRLVPLETCRAKKNTFGHGAQHPNIPEACGMDHCQRYTPSCLGNLCKSLQFHWHEYFLGRGTCQQGTDKRKHPTQKQLPWSSLQGIVCNGDTLQLRRSPCHKHSPGLDLLLLIL